MSFESCEWYKEELLKAQFSPIDGTPMVHISEIAEYDEKDLPSIENGGLDGPNLY